MRLFVKRYNEAVTRHLLATNKFFTFIIVMISTKLKILLACLSLSVLVAGVSSAQCRDQFLETRRVVLDQKSQVLGAVESATRLPDGSFAVATADPGVFLFKDDGSFVRQLGRAGRGPFEYLGRLTVRPAGENVAVWDGGNRKLLLFAPNGTHLREWSRLGRAVSDFAVRGDTLFAYHSGGINEDYVSVYHYDNQKATAVSLGKAPGEHFPLSLLEGSGDLTYDSQNESLLYASPAEPVVHLYNPRSGRRDVWHIEDPDFDTEAASEYTSLEDINADILGAAEQALRSSRFYFLQAVGGQVLSVLQNGELVYRKSFTETVSGRARSGTSGSLDMGGVRTYTRTFNAHLHTREGNDLFCESFSFARDQISSDSPIVGPTPRGFLILNTRSEEDNSDYVLVEYYVAEQ